MSKESEFSKQPSKTVCARARTHDRTGNQFSPAAPPTANRTGRTTCAVASGPSSLSSVAVRCSPPQLLPRAPYLFKPKPLLVLLPPASQPRYRRTLSCAGSHPPIYAALPHASHQPTDTVHAQLSPRETCAHVGGVAAVARRGRHGSGERVGGGGGGGARAPSVDGGAELGDGGGEVRAGGGGPGVPAALPARGVLLRGRGDGARGDHQGAQGPHVPLARRILPRRRPRPPPRRRPAAAAAGGGGRGRRVAAAVRQVQRLRRAHRGGAVRPGPGRVAPRRRRRPREAALLRQGARPGALLLPAALRPGDELQMRSDGAGVQLGAPHRGRGVGDDMLQQLGQDTRGEEAGRRHRQPRERAAGPRAGRRRTTTLRQAGRAHRGLLAGAHRGRHGVLLLPRHGTDAQDAAAAAGVGGCRRGLRAHLRVHVADGGEDEGRQGGDDRDGGEDGHGRQERQLAGERGEGRVRGGGLAAGEDRRGRAGGAAGQEPGRRDGGGGRVPRGRAHLRREPDLRGHGAGGPVRAGDQGAAARARGVRHGQRWRGGRRAGAARRRRARQGGHGRAPQGRGRQPPRRARELAHAGCLKLKLQLRD